MYPLLSCSKYVDLCGVHFYFSLISGYNIFILVLFLSITYFILVSFLAITYAFILVFSLSPTSGLFHIRFSISLWAVLFKIRYNFLKIKTLILQHLHSEAA